MGKDNAEYQEDCLRTNVSEISRYLKIFPKRTQGLQIDEENAAEKTKEDEAVNDDEEEVEQEANDMYFSLLDKNQSLGIVTSQKIKEEPYSEDLMISEEPEIEEYPIFQDVNDDNLSPKEGN